MSGFLRQFRSPTARSTIFYYIGNFAISAGRYLFHLTLLRLLLPAQYGEFLSYNSFLYLLAIPTSTISSVVTKYASHFYGENDSKSINHFFYFILRLSLPLVIILSVGTILLSPFLSQIFKAHSVAFIVLGVSMTVSLFSGVIRSYLISFQEFTFNVILSGGEVVLSIILSAILILFGLGATGAVVGQLLTSILAMFIVFIKIKPNIWPPLKSVQKFHVDIRSFTGYSLLSSVGFLSLISTDILLVRYFFDPVQSGIYASLSILGRMIFFGLSPLSGILFPIAAKRFAAKENHKAAFFKLAGLTIFLGTIGITIFSIFPHQVISILSGRNYDLGAGLLPAFSLTMGLFALNQLTITYFMSINLPQANIILLIIAILQPLLIVLFHNNIANIVYINLSLQCVFTIILLSKVTFATLNIWPTSKSTSP